MVDTLVKLLEKSIELLKLRKDARSRAFDVLVSPTFEGLNAVHKDYLRLFDSCYRQLKDGADLGVVAKQLVSDRLEQEAVRRSLLAFMRSHSEDPHLQRYSCFFDAVGRYLHHASLSAHDTRSMMLLHETEHWAEQEKGSEFLIHGSHPVLSAPDPRSLLLGVTERFLHDIRRSWDVVAGEYAKLTVSSL
jgi:hypothetical protein